MSVDNNSFDILKMYIVKFSENDANDGITFEDYITGRFNAKYFNGSWWSENELQWKDQVGVIH